MQQWLEANWGNVITAVSLVAAVYFYFKSLKLRKPTCVIRSNNIFSELEREDPVIEVKFPGYGPLVKSLTVTKIAFWNAGRETINKQDVVKDREIALCVKNGLVILSAIIIERTDRSNKIECKVNQERTKAGITFDYLDHNQGALIQVFHSGTGNDDIEVKGTIKGSRPVKRYALGSSPRKKQLSRWVVVPLVGAF